MLLALADFNPTSIVVTIIFSTIVGFVVWMIQAHMTAKRQKREEEEKALRKERADEEKERRQTVLDRLEKLEKQGTIDAQTLAMLKQEMLPMAEAMKRKLVEILTHPSEEFEIPDALLAKVKEVGASLPPELRPLLEERAHSTNPHVTEQEKLAAEALPIITRLAELEAEEAETAEITSIQLVTSTSKTPSTKRREEKGA